MALVANLCGNSRITQNIPSLPSSIRHSIIHAVGEICTMVSVLLRSAVQRDPLRVSSGAKLKTVGWYRTQGAIPYNHFSISFPPFRYTWLNRCSRCHLRFKMRVSGRRVKNSPPRSDEQLSAPFRRVTLRRFKGKKNDRCAARVQKKTVVIVMDQEAGPSISVRRQGRVLRTL